MSANTHRTTPEARVKMLDSMLSERGFVCFFAVAQPAINNAAELLGILHRELERRGMTEDEIRELVRNEENP